MIGKKILIAVLAVLVIIFLVCELVPIRFGWAYKNDLVITSPDGKYQLLVREGGTLGGTAAEIYAIDPKLPMLLNKFIKTEIGRTSADDSVYPFFDGNYEILWEEDCVTIYYFSGRECETSDISTWQKVTCKLP